MSIPRSNIYQRKILDQFKLVMSRKLQSHRDWDTNGKPGWRSQHDLEQLMCRLYGELEELYALVDRYESGAEVRTADVEEECADVANCAMIIADWFRYGEKR